MVCGLIDRKKKKKFLFNAKEHALLDKADLRVYEEVARMPPFQRKTLIIIGAEGIGRRTLKTRLLNLDPDRFGTTIPRILSPLSFILFSNILLSTFQILLVKRGTMKRTAEVIILRLAKKWKMILLKESI